MSRKTRRLSVAALIVAVPLLALAGRQAAEGIHGPPEPTSFWVFTVGTQSGEKTPDAEDPQTIALADGSRAESLLWGGGLAVAGGALLVLGVRGLRRSEAPG
ncbi:MAG: hypothetical protein ACRDI0_05910 [Actinomycetota bacterium]